MPDLVTHYYFGKKLYDGLPPQIKSKILSFDIYAFTTGGPDPFFFYKFLNSKENKRIREFGNYMHTNDSKAFFINLILQTKKTHYQDLLFSYLCGFIAHYSLDSTVHPYIFNQTGKYKGDIDTIEYRGLHTKLERAIDSYIIRNKFEEKPWKFKIVKKVLPLKDMPEVLKEDLNEVYEKTFNFKEAYEVINKTVKDQRKFYKFIYDPFGFKDWFFKKIDNGKGSIDFGTISYYKKELPQYDIFNQEHAIWTNPIDESIKSREDLNQLFEKASNLANELIEAVYNYIYLDFNLDLNSYFLNLSYLTGIDCNNKSEMKYFNNIFKVK